MWLVVGLIISLVGIYLNSSSFAFIAAGEGALPKGETTCLATGSAP